MPPPGDSAAALRALPFTYFERGWTAWPEPPVGYRAVQRSRVLGSGRAVFDRAGRTLLGWQLHRFAGLRPICTEPRAVVGARVQLRIGVGPVAVTARCQVVWTLAEDRRRGFSYGALVGHPVSGEESFVLELADDDQVHFTIRSFSRPATLPARLAGPLTPLAQRIGMDHYLATMVELTRP